MISGKAFFLPSEAHIIVMELNQLLHHFTELYGQEGEGPAVYFAPGRVNLIGEHTDYNGGFVLPCALQYGTWLLIRPNEEEELRFATTNFPSRHAIGLSRISEKVPGEWVNYPLGIFDQFSHSPLVPGFVKLRGFDMLFSGDIPDSAGLSSSASIEMVMVYALNDLLVAGMEMTSMVKLARASENTFVGVNCGIMDMFAVGFGMADHALFLNCLNLVHKGVPLFLNGLRLMIVNTNKKRGLASSKYNERVEECRKALEILAPYYPAEALGEIGFMQFFKVQERIEDEVIRRRARHVISENQRVLNAVSCLMKSDIQQFGALMNASHESLRDNYEVTGAELDILVEEAQAVYGVLGARMTGAGFGGCTVNLMKEEVADEFMNRVGERYLARTGIEPSFYNAVVSGGVRKIM